MNQLEINKKMTPFELDRHSALIIKPIKKKRKCVSTDCDRVFVSNNAGHRMCDRCKRAHKSKGRLAELIYI